MGDAASRFERLATLVVLLGQRRREFDAFRAQLEPLRDTGLELVQGEAALLAELQQHLGGAFSLLQTMPHATPDATLAQIEEGLSDPAWEVAAEVLPDLQAKNLSQAGLLEQLGKDLQAWDVEILELARPIDDARFNGANFTGLDGELRGARTLLTAIRTDLAERRYANLRDLHSRAAQAIATLGTSVAQSSERVDRVRQQVKQADLLIMQVGVSEEYFEYRVLLRSADRLQTRGINIIQDVLKVSRQDRNWLLEMLGRLTEELNEAQRAAHPTPGPALGGGVAGDGLAAGPAGAPTDASPAAPPAPGAARTISPAQPAATGASRQTDETLGAIGRFMFRMVIPEQMQVYLQRERWSFSITTNDLDLPWELIAYENLAADGADALSYLCLDRSVSRMPLGGVFPPSQPRRAPALVRMHKRRMLLIHSDPRGNLPAAGAEVDAIAQALGEDLELQRVDPLKATNSHINEILMGRSFDFLHYAGHASFNKTDPPRSGLELRDGLLTADKIRRLSKGGSLVFLNACESGTVARENQAQQVSYLLSNPEPVVGLASAFVYSGALGCVGSLWPVYDRPASDLAVRFYTYVLQGEPTGEALRRARSEVRMAYPGMITWAAYVLYGDPTFRLMET